ncbi:MAG: AhpC/TSA family protein [Bacteroidales bacterium]|nr:AhpC/TSA family protein [Bacteroidales bacterium]
MKKGLLFILIIFIGISCKNSKEDHFKVSGNISNAPGEMIFLEKILQNSFVGIDSTIISDDGTFELTGNSPIPAFYSLRIDPSTAITLILHPGENVIFESDKNNFRSEYKISGSKDSELLKELDDKFNHYYNQLLVLNERYTSVQYSENNSDILSLREELDSIYLSIYYEYREYIMNFIDKNLSSLASFTALFQAVSQQEYLLNPYDDYEYFRKVDSALTAMYPTSEITKFMNESMLQVEEQKKYMKQKESQLSYGSIAPEIALPSPKGDTIKLSSLKGKFVLIDFWASWCAPCRQENPNLVECFKKFAHKNFTIYQVSLDRDKTSWNQGITDDKLGSWYHVSDLQMWNSAVVPVYNIQGIPTNFLLDKQGRIIAKDLRGDKLEQVLSDILNK